MRHDHGGHSDGHLFMCATTPSVEDVGDGPVLKQRTYYILQ